ncbi:hypothetical protein [Bradyrhizobium sp. BR 10261]|uniref:hypothetical protein n=1 Tax=Bradyrhizobium sp. BR 10261 TaxID=2749992 RepID=UPI001C646292|nr:hypothetical protein [Bradyrhizobium sp. BR 10261]MBW7964154.1 hypothetical protein [Bradyrhizobium sp. BR 10261]
MQVLTKDLPSNDLPEGLCTDGAKQGFLTGPDVAACETSKPASFAKRFVAHRAASIEEEVSSTVVLSEGLTAFATDETLMKQFLLELARAKVLTAAEVAEGVTAKTSSSMVSRLKKIKQNAKVILHPKILPYVQPGYSVLYELALLYEAIEDIRGIEDADAAISKLHELLASSDGPATREWLKGERSKLSPPAPAKSSKVSQQQTTNESRAGSSHSESAAQRDEVVQSETGTVVGGAEADPTDPDDDELVGSTVIFTPGCSAFLVRDHLVRVLDLAENIGDDAVLLVQGSKSSLQQVRKSILKKIAATNVHLITNSPENGWMIADEEPAS